MRFDRIVTETGAGAIGIAGKRRSVPALEGIGAKVLTTVGGEAGRVD